MNRMQQRIARIALVLLVTSGCASASSKDGLSAEERAAARSIPGTGSAVATFCGVDYVGSFILDVTGDTVSFYVNGYDSELRGGLSGRLMVPEDFSRQPDGSIDFRFRGTADGSVGTLGIHSGPAYQVESGEVRMDHTGLVSAQIVGVRVPDHGPDGYEIAETGGARETLSVTGHLTATCNVRLPSNDIILDAERTANPRCAELLRGL